MRTLTNNEKVFAKRVALTLKDMGITCETVTDEMTIEAGKAVLRKDMDFTNLMLDRSPETKKFRDAMAMRVWHLCKATT